MSESSRPDPAVPNSADPAQPSGDPQQVRSEIEAEIADHLASSASALVRDGADPVAAEEQARRSFGNVSRVAWQCLWIRLGDQIMFRAATIVIGILMAIGIVALAWNGWQVQRTMNEQMDDLKAELAALNQTQRELLQRETSTKLIEITGKAYYGARRMPPRAPPFAFAGSLVKSHSRSMWFAARRLMKTGRFAAARLSLAITT